MKNILTVILLATFLLFVSCSEDQSFPTKSTTTELCFEEDSLIINLQSLNDSLIASSSDVEGRSIISIGESIHQINVIAADIKGAIKGGVWGFKTMGIPGIFLGATIVGAIYSICAALATTPLLVSDSRAIASFNQNISKERIELAYASIRADSALYTDLYNLDINIPSEYQKSYEVGKYHNLTLKYIFEDSLPTVTYETGFSPEEIKLLRSSEFIQECDYAIENPLLITETNLDAIYTKEEKVIQLFIDVLKKYPNSTSDVEFIVNKYIEIIENDAQINNVQKQIVFNSLSTAAYSASFWYSRQE